MLMDVFYEYTDCLNVCKLETLIENIFIERITDTPYNGLSSMCIKFLFSVYFGDDLVGREYLDTFTQLVIPQPYKKIQSRAAVQGWRALFNRTDQVEFHVWQPLGADSYRLINQYVYDPNITGIVNISLPVDERFDVDVNDVIGFTTTTLGPIPYDNYVTPCTQVARGLVGGTAIVGDEKHFTAFYGCRFYSFHVLLMGKYDLQKIK